MFFMNSNNIIHFIDMNNYKLYIFIFTYYKVFKKLQLTKTKFDLNWKC